jgi:hypothetical protein
MINLAIIIGSTRPGRNGEAVAGWVHHLAVNRGDAMPDQVTACGTARQAPRRGIHHAA